MSDIKWCDFGGHAFSANDPDAESYSNTRLSGNQFGDTAIRERLDICGPCKAKGRMGIRSLAISSPEATPSDG